MFVIKIDWCWLSSLPNNTNECPFEDVIIDTVKPSPVKSLLTVSTKPSTATTTFAKVSEVTFKVDVLLDDARGCFEKVMSYPCLKPNGISSCALTTRFTIATHHINGLHSKRAVSSIELLLKTISCSRPWRETAKHNPQGSCNRVTDLDLASNAGDLQETWDTDIAHLHPKFAHHSPRQCQQEPGHNVDNKKFNYLKCRWELPHKAIKAHNGNDNGHDWCHVVVWFKNAQIASNKNAMQTVHPTPSNCRGAQNNSDIQHVFLGGNCELTTWKLDKTQLGEDHHFIGLCNIFEVHTARQQWGLSSQSSQALSKPEKWCCQSKRFHKWNFEQQRHLLQLMLPWGMSSSMWQEGTYPHNSFI